MRFSTSLKIGLVFTAASLLPSCFIVKDDLLSEEEDGGMVNTLGAETCGDMNAPLLMPGSVITVDTRGMANDQSASLCTSVWRTTAAGSDAFFRVQVASGEYWHFHIEALLPNLDPFVYVMPPGCSDSNLCSRARASNRCSDIVPPDEHFGVQFDQSGTWFLGIDDAKAGGGLYRVSAFRPMCQNSMEEHGESCDGDNGGLDTCHDQTCRLYLPGAMGMPTSGEGTRPNDDKFWAPELRASLGQSITISGTVRGECDPDVYMVPILAAGQDLRVSLVDSNGVCITSPAAPNDIQVRITDRVDSFNSLGSNVATCFSATTTTGLPAGEHFVEVIGGDPNANFVYRLKFEVLP
jgi:hypothetical protein